MSQAFNLSCDHRIPRDEAADLLRAFQAQITPGAHKATAFNRSALEQLLAQPGAAGIRIYHAHHEDGSATKLMVAVDAGGQDLASPDATFMQNGANCPPFCVVPTWY